MLLLSLLAATINEAPSLAALREAVGQCNREVVAPVFSGEGARRMQFLTDSYAEQEAIFAALNAIAQRRQLVRSGTPQAGDSEAGLRLQLDLINDRQQLLEDRRTLERLRREAVDQMRREYLQGCANANRLPPAARAAPAPEGGGQ